MLSPEYLETVAEPVLDVWERFNIEAVKDIARRITKAGGRMTATAAWQIYKLQQTGKTADQIRRALMIYTGYSDAQMRHVFRTSLFRAYQTDLSAFIAGGIITEAAADQYLAAFNNNAGLLMRSQELLDLTRGELHNFTQTAPEQAETAYIQACDRAFLAVRSGVYSKAQAITDSIEQMAALGLDVRYPSGHIDTIETAVRRAVTSGVSQAAGKLTERTCQDMGCNTVIVSSHIGARVSEDPIANHAGWQGKVYRLDTALPSAYGPTAEALQAHGTDAGEYPGLVESTGYGTGPGLCGWNCRHSFMPFIPGVSQNNMPQYDDDENAERYRETQQQRAMERAIRRTQRRVEALTAALEVEGDAETAEHMKQRLTALKQRRKQQLKAYSEYSEDHGLPEQRDRLYTARKAKAPT